MLAFPFLLVACRPTGPAGELQARLDAIVASEPRVPGAILVVHAAQLDFSGSSGAFALDDDARELREDDLFRVASVTKTFVSVALLARVEAGALSLDDAIRDRLSPESLAALEGGGYDPDAITVRELLDHTAGIYDYTDADAYYEAIHADPTHRWTRAEQLAVAMNEGAPLNAPGEAYAYGDTHYILAGEVLERSTGLGLAESLRESLHLDELGLSSTWLESLEDPPASDAFGRLSHPYIGDEDTRGWDPSWDLYGGGGLASSAADLAAFMDALFAGEILGDEGMAELLTIPPEGVGAFYGIDGGLGIDRFDVDGGLGECWAGYGYFSTEVVRCPDLEVTWAATLNQAEPRDGDAIAVAVLNSLE